MMTLESSKNTRIDLYLKKVWSTQKMVQGVDSRLGVVNS